MDKEEIGNSAELGYGFLDACAGLFIGLVGIEDLASDKGLGAIDAGFLNRLVDLFLGTLYSDVNMRSKIGRWNSSDIDLGTVDVIYTCF